MNQKTVYNCLICTLLFVLVANPVSASATLNLHDSPGISDIETKEMVSAWGTEFTVKRISDEIVQVHIRNPSEKPISSMFVVNIDKHHVAKPEFELDPGEEQEWTIDISPGIDATKDHHQLIVSTAGAMVQFNFTRKVDISGNSTVPIPYIRNVSVGNGYIKGQPSTVANVTIVNPAPRIYALKLMASTEGTNGSHYVSAIYPGKTETITVELLESRGTRVAGEVRLYDGKLTSRRGAIDQVEFVGRAGKDTRFWNVTYQPVRAPWQPNNYVYENESVDTASDTDYSGVIDPVRAYKTELLALLGAIVIVLVGKRLR